MARIDAPITPAQEKAMELKNRLLSGENVPLDELREFIRLANGTLARQRKAADTPTDVDFF